MFAGLPCSGISGLVYLLAALCAPFHEVGLLLRGRQSANRWPTVVFLSCMSAAILSATGASLWLLGIQLQTKSAGGGAGVPAIRFGGLNVSVALFVSVLVTASVDVVVGLLRFIQRRRTAVLHSSTLDQEPIPMTASHRRLPDASRVLPGATRVSPSTLNQKDSEALLVVGDLPGHVPASQA